MQPQLGVPDQTVRAQQQARGNTVTITQNGVKYATPLILVWRNGQWGAMPYAEYFWNNLREHIRQIKGYEVKRREELRVRMMLNQNQVVVVNKLQFRFKHQPKRTVHDQGTQDKQAA